MYLTWISWSDLPSMAPSPQKKQLVIKGAEMTWSRKILLATALGDVPGIRRANAL